MVRYRCSMCGNLTRFDVTVLRRTRSFHHYSLGGRLQVEQVEVLDEQVEEVACRWCGHGRSVEVLSTDHATVSADEPGDGAGIDRAPDEPDGPA